MSRAPVCASGSSSARGLGQRPGERGRKPPRAGGDGPDPGPSWEGCLRAAEEPPRAHSRTSAALRAGLSSGRHCAPLTAVRTPQRRESPSQGLPAVPLPPAETVAACQVAVCHIRVSGRVAVCPSQVGGRAGGPGSRGLGQRVGARALGPGQAAPLGRARVWGSQLGFLTVNWCQ